MITEVGNWKEFLSLSSEEEMTAFRKHERTCRPLGQELFVDRVEVMLARTLRTQKPGPKKTDQFHILSPEIPVQYS